MNLTHPPYLFTASVDGTNAFHSEQLNVLTPHNNHSTSDLVVGTSTSSAGLESDHPGEDDVGGKVVKGIFLSLCILVAISGNLLVCTAVFTERRLKRVKNNYFIVSLAVADLFVACVVMTFAVPNEIQSHWMFGEVFCEFWISFDIMCSTASILNLCVISFDRYKHIHNAMYYDTWMTTRKALILIVSVWFLSALISFLPIHLGWHTVPMESESAHAHENITLLNSTILPASTSTPVPATTIITSTEIVNQTIVPEPPFQCTMELNFVYALISSTISFYVPCLVMLVIYFKLFLFARAHAVSIRSMKRPAMPAGSRQPMTNGSTKSSYRASDHKAAFTLGVITGVFLVCWLPFFIINPIAAYNRDLISLEVFNIVTWAGYANSCLNPIIYSIFNTEFREAFKKILSFRMCRRDNAYLPSSTSRSSSLRSKLKKAEYETHATDNGSSVLRKTSKDHLFNEKVTKL